MKRLITGPRDLNAFEGRTPIQNCSYDQGQTVNNIVIECFLYTCYSFVHCGYTNLLGVSISVRVVDRQEVDIIGVQQSSGSLVCAVAGQQVVDTPQAGGGADPSGIMNEVVVSDGMEISLYSAMNLTMK